MHAMMFAAGLGERLRPHTDKIAKPALPFLNIPILCYPLFFLEKAGLSHLVVNTHHLPLTVEKATQFHSGSRYPVQFSHEEPQILGSGGGLAQAKPHLGGADEIVLYNADIVSFFGSENPVQDLINTHRSEKALATLYLTQFPNGQERHGGVYVDGARRVQKFSKTPVENRSWTPYHFAGVMVVNREVFSQLPAGPSNIFYDVFQRLIEQGKRIQGHLDLNTIWVETGNPTDFLAGTKKCLQLLGGNSRHADQLRSTLSRFDRGWDNFKLGGIYSHGKLATGFKSDAIALVGKGAKVDSSAKLVDFAVIGPQSSVGPQALIEATVVGERVNVPAGQHVKDSILI